MVCLCFCYCPCSAFQRLDQSLTPVALFVVFSADEEPGVAGYPLQECQGDCDSDDECAGELICFQRDVNGVVPGCVGVAVDDTDYCIKPPQQLVAAVTRSGAGSFP
jgi:hypothetical protein